MRSRSHDEIEAINQYYMEIINAMPDIVYWVDKECNLKGCNSNFCNLLELQSLNDFQGTPYEKMIKFANWDKTRVEAFKLDDMNVLFTGQATYNVEEKPIHDRNGNTFYFQTNRVPMYNTDKEVTGLIVVLTNISLSKLVAGQGSGLVDKNNKTSEVSNTVYLPKILLVEDNLIAQNVTKSLLVSLKCQVDIADTFDSAVKLFQPGKYDFVLMDIGLDNSSGYLVAKQFRSQEDNTNHRVPIIALTGYEADIVKFDCSHYFMDGVLSKPLTREQAEQIIKHYIYDLDVPVHGLKSI